MKMNLFDLSWILQFRSYELTFFFKFFSFFGSELFFFITIAIGYWSWKKDLFRDLSILVCISAITNCWLKVIFSIPRPTIEKLVPILDPFSFPSRDVQVITTFLTTIALFTKNTFFWIISLFLITCVAMSRVYLGAHYPIDVFFGFIIGFIITIAYYYLINNKILKHLNAKDIILTFFIIVFLGFYIYYIKNNLNNVNLPPAGALLGICIDIYLITFLIIIK